MIWSGTVSRRLPFRAARSRARGWSQRITPVVRVSASSSDTANPRRRAKPPPVVIGRTRGVLVSSLKGAGGDDHDRPGPPLFMAGRRVQADEPDLASLHYSSSLPTGLASSQARPS